MDMGNRSKEQLLEEIEDLKKKLLEANAANAAKETFLSNMSHDIRTPMNAIVGMTALAKKHIDEKPRVIDALGKIETASSHLLGLINDILDMSRINSGKMQISQESFFLGDLIHDIMIIVKPQMEQKGHSYNLEIEDIEIEYLIGDPLRLRQVFVNIINNSVKYTKSGGNIELSFSECMEEERVRLFFVCKDNGIGMSSEFLARIFEPFERVNNSTISGIEGTGLGMSIVKRILEAMDGTIEVTSREGEGTEVSISVPLGYSHEKLDLSALEGSSVLIIEADPQFAAKYEKILTECSIDHTIVPSLKDALNMLTLAAFEGKQYDIAVIGDKQEDNGSVLDIASYLSASNPELTLVLVNTLRWEDIEYKAQKLGIQQFIPVPFFRKSLINGMAAALGKTTGESAPSAYPDLSGKFILLAEDNFINREIAKEMLSATNAVIETAENGQQAVDMFKASEPGHYTMILMDVQMPVMGGYEATRLIRESSRTDSTLPIYAMTANTFAEDIEKAKANGMDGHIAKPVDINTLMQTIKRAVAR